MHSRRSIFQLGLCLPLLGAGCGRDPGSPRRDDRYAALHDLFAKEWSFACGRIRCSPHRWAGWSGTTNCPSSVSPRKTLLRFLQTLATSLDGISVDALGNADRSAMTSFAEIQRNLDLYEAGGYLMPVNSDSAFHSDFPRIVEEAPLASTEDYENLIARLNARPRAVDEMVELLREGLKRGFTPPAATMKGFERTAAAHCRHPGGERVRCPFSALSRRRAAIRAGAVATEGRRAIQQAIVPGYRKLFEFFTASTCRVAARRWARTIFRMAGFLRARVRYFTTLPIGPDEIHQTGLREVERIRKEMDDLIRKTGFRGSFIAFLDFLRTDRRFYAKTPEELLRRAAWIAKRMDGQLPAFFGRLPRQPYTVEPVPDAIAPKYTSGRYVPAPYGGTKPGIYWVNTYALETRPLYTQEALTLHEAVPGHHLQIALAAEAEDLPPFRRFAYFSAFGEGWGLYSEFLGKEAGFYTDPYSEFGRLTYEMWRACRLVVDTGVHAMGWTRQQMIDYLAANTALPMHECITETDRYISWPGQALAYKLGEITIRELRAKAEERLGDRFEIRAFHDALLENGAIPLTTLRRVVDNHIANRTRT